MVANKYAFLQITRRRFLNEWDAFKKVISRRNIRRRITIPLTLSNLKLLRRILPPETELSRQMTTSTTSIDIMGLQAAYANLHTDQERDYFMQRYHDVISSFGGKTSYDADNRPLLVMRSNLWASGYDVDGTDQT